MKTKFLDRQTLFFYAGVLTGATACIPFKDDVVLQTAFSDMAQVARDLALQGGVMTSIVISGDPPAVSISGGIE